MLFRNNLTGWEGRRTGQWKELSKDVVSAGDLLEPDPTGSSAYELYHRVKSQHEARGGTSVAQVSQPLGGRGRPMLSRVAPFDQGQCS